MYMYIVYVVSLIGAVIVHVHYVSKAVRGFKHLRERCLFANAR